MAAKPVSRRVFRTLSACICSGLLLVASPSLHADNRADGGFLRDITTDYVTPHLNWGKPQKDGPIKVFAIVPRNLAAREIVELSQRTEIEFQAVATANATALAVPVVYEASTIGTSEYEKTQELLGKLDGKYDVIVLANIDFKILPLEAQYKILKHTHSGGGLLITYLRPFPYKKVFDHPDEGAQQIAGMFDLSVLPKSVAKLPLPKILNTYAFGEGRVATISYPGTMSAGGGGLGLTAFEEYAPTGWKARYENNMALVIRALQWVGKRDLHPSVAPAKGQEPVVAGKEAAFKLDFQGANAGTTVRVRIRDAWNEIKWTKDYAVSGNGVLALAVPALAAGTHYLDTLIEAEGKHVTSGVFRYDVAPSAGTLDIKTAKGSFEPGDIVKATIQLQQPLGEDGELTIDLADLPGRNVWFRKMLAVPKGTAELQVEFPARINPTVAGALTCSLAAGSRDLLKEEKILFFPKRELELFPTILWKSIPPYLSEMYAGQISQSSAAPIGLNDPGSRGENARLAALFNQRFIPYLTRIGLKAGDHGQTLSANWLGMSKEEAEAATEGDGSFNNPKVRDFWKKTVDRRMQGLPEVGPVIYTLGDENFFSYDAGYSPADAAAFTDYLRERYKKIENLNAEWGTTYADFGAVEHLSPKTMREKALFPMWYEHRRFMEKQYADVHHYLADCIKAHDPHALVGSEGSVPGDLELTMEKLDFWGPYTDAVSNELLRSIGGNKLRSLWWGYGAPNFVYPLWKPLLQGVVNGSAWYTSGIETASLISIDFTLAEYYRKMKPHLEALEAGQAQALVSTPLKQDGIAILWSHASYSASIMDERFWKPGDSINVLMNFCYRQGLNFDMVTSRMVEEGALSTKYKILFLCGASALSQSEVERITAFVQQGGIVVADMNPGILNASCRPLEQSSLASLFGVANFDWQIKPQLKPVNIEQSLRGRGISFRAEKAFQSASVPVFSTKEMERGLAILLNFNLSSAQNTAHSETSIDRLLLELLGVAGIEPEVSITGLTTAELVVRLRQGLDYQVLGILAPTEDVGKTAKIRLPKSFWVYEVNKGLVGQGSEIDGNVKSPLLVYSLFDEPQQAPAFQLSKATVPPGEPTSIQPHGFSESGLYRLDIVDPTGMVLSKRTRFFKGAAPGTAGDIHFAYTDPAGKYVIKIVDVRTGLQTEADVLLTAPSK